MARHSYTLGPIASTVEPAPLQVEQQIAPILRTLAGAIGEADQFLAAFRVAPISTRMHCFSSSKRGWRWIPSAQMYVTLGRRIAPLSGGMVVKPAVL